MLDRPDILHTEGGEDDKDGSFTIDRSLYKVEKYLTMMEETIRRVILLKEMTKGS